MTRASLLLASAVLVLAACGSDNGEADTSGPASAGSVGVVEERGWDTERSARERGAVRADPAVIHVRCRVRNVPLHDAGIREARCLGGRQLLREYRRGLHHLLR